MRGLWPTARQAKLCPSMKPLVPRWSLIVIDINLFWIVFASWSTGFLALWHRGTSTSPIGILISLWVHGWLLSPEERGSHLGLKHWSPSGQSPHTGLRSRVLWVSSLPEVSPHQDIAGISPHHQNNYGLDTYKLKLKNKPMNMSTKNNSESRNSLPSPLNMWKRISGLSPALGSWLQ